MASKEIRKAILIPAEITKPLVALELPSDEDAAADVLRGAVGGFFELLHVPSGLRRRNPYPRHGKAFEEVPEAGLWVNEDGKALQFPYNMRATVLCVQLGVGLRADDCIKGDAVLTGGADANGDTLGVPSWFLSTLRIRK